MPDEPRDPRHPGLVAALRGAGCVFAEDEADVLLGSARDDDELAALLARRVAGEPLEHVVGWAEFCGLRVGVEPGVFVPRPRSEAMVAVAAGLVGPRGPGATVLDLCCGSGALGLALVSRLRDARLWACDVDPVAVRCARRNLGPAGGTALLGDLFGALPAALRGRFDAVVANVPYVPSGEVRLMPREAREHEPAAALDGGPDGLGVLRRVAADVGGWLAPGGHVVSEVNVDQAPAAVAALAAGGLAARGLPADEETVVVVGTLVHQSR